MKRKAWFDKVEDDLKEMIPDFVREIKNKNTKASNAIIIAAIEGLAAYLVTEVYGPEIAIKIAEDGIKNHKEYKLKLRNIH